MGGTILQLIQNYIGIDFNTEILSLKPNLPSKWRKIKIRVPFNKIIYEIKIKIDEIEVKVLKERTKVIPIRINENQYDLSQNNEYTLKIVLAKHK